MATKVIASKKFTLQLRDLLRGGIMAALTAALVVIQKVIETGEMSFNWKQVAMAAIGGGVGYLLKNWLIEPAKIITTVSGNDAKVDVVEANIKEAV